MPVKKGNEVVPIEYREIKASFKLVFYSILLLVIICLIVSVILGIQPNLTDQGKTVMESSLTVFKMGAGAIFGLLGGKVLP